MCSMIKILNNHVYNWDIYLIIYQGGRVEKWFFAHFNCHKSQVQLPNKQMDSKPGINIQVSLTGYKWPGGLARKEIGLVACKAHCDVGQPIVDRFAGNERSVRLSDRQAGRTIDSIVKRSNTLDQTEKTVIWTDWTSRFSLVFKTLKKKTYYIWI